MHRISVFLVALSAFAGDYAASDDGRVVYFTGSPTGEEQATRLWRWSNGEIRTILDGTAPVRLARLSPDGNFALIQFPNLRGDRWQILLDGAALPLVEIKDAQHVSMSRNGRWVVIYRNQAGRAAELFTLNAGGLWSTAVWPDPRVSALGPFARGAGVTDDAQVGVACPDAPNSNCLWDSRSGATSYVRNGQMDSSGGTKFAWLLAGLRIERLVRYDDGNSSAPSLSFTCPYYRPLPFQQGGFSQSSIVASDPSGRLVLVRCGQVLTLVDSTTNTGKTLTPTAVLNSTLTAQLERPTATNFRWTPANNFDSPIARFDVLNFSTSYSRYGLFSSPYFPDFTIEWGGHTLPWLKGAFGYFYAPIPADVVPGATDSLRLSSVTRPWLNVQRSVVVAPHGPQLLPLVSDQPAYKLIHGDYSALVTPDNPARAGERIHVYLTGISPYEIDIESPLNSASLVYFDSMLFSQPPPLALRVAALSETSSGYSFTLLTLEIPAGARYPIWGERSPRLVLKLGKRDGVEITTSASVWAVIN